MKKNQDTAKVRFDYVWILWLTDGGMYERTDIMAGVFATATAARKAITREIANHPYCGLKRKASRIVKLEVES